MINPIKFLCQAFPVKISTVLSGLCYGVLLVTVNWYPLPALLQNINLPNWVVYTAALAFIGIVFWAFMSGKLFAHSWGVVGWTAIGYLVSGVILTGLFYDASPDMHGKLISILISGLLVLIVYIVIFWFHLKKP